MSVLTRWGPFRGLQQEMRRLERDMGQLFDRWSLPGIPSVEVAYPAVNMWEDEDFVHVEAELPGLKLSDLEITVTGDNRLTVKGKRPPVAMDKVECHRVERISGDFERVLLLPIKVDAGKVEARLENGVLTIKMAKSPAAKPRKIPVKAE
jgi:HSP20 family protein